MTNVMTVTGRILNLEEKRASNGNPFYIVDLETFYGPNVRFQAWEKAYDFIKRNQLRSADKSGIGGDYIDVIGYTHNYILENNKGQKNEYITFKSKDVKRPTARVTYSGKLYDIGNKSVEVLSRQTGFLFIPETPYLEDGEWKEAKPIHCIIEQSNPDYYKLLEIYDKVNPTEVIAEATAVKAVISGAVDNTDKKLTKVLVDTLQITEEDN